MAALPNLSPAKFPNPTFSFAPSRNEVDSGDQVKLMPCAILQRVGDRVRQDAESCERFGDDEMSGSWRRTTRMKRLAMLLTNFSVYVQFAHLPEGPVPVIHYFMDGGVGDDQVMDDDVCDQK